MGSEKQLKIALSHTTTGAEYIYRLITSNAPPSNGNKEIHYI